MRAVLVALFVVAVGVSCSSGDDSADLSESTVETTALAGSDSDDAQSGTPSTALPSDLLLEDPDGATVSVNVTCLEGTNGMVLVEVLDGPPGELLDLDIAGQPAQLQVGPDGLGGQGSQVVLGDGATITVEFPNGPQTGDLPAC